MPGSHLLVFPSLEHGMAEEAIGISLKLLPSPARRIGLGEIADRDNN